MKRYAPWIILFLFAAMLFNAMLWSGDAHVNFDGDDIDGPLGLMLATLFAGGGTLLGAFITIVVGTVLAVVFAGVGVILLGVVAMIAVGIALAISPLLLPLLLPVAIVWYLVHRSRKVQLHKTVAPA